MHDSRSLRFVLERPLRVALGALLLLAACGGGGGGNGGGGGGGPTPPPGTSPTPRPSLAPTPVPTPNPERVKLLLAEGETVAGLTVSDIEDAGFNNSGAIGAIVTVRNANGGRAVLLGGADGDFTPVVTPDSPPEGADMRTLSRVRLLEDGTSIFESGDGLDTDRLYFVKDGAVQGLAGAPPGPVFPTFRILGDLAFGLTGTIGFIGGGDECETDTSGANPRTLCDIKLFVAQDGVVTEVRDDAITLEGISPTQPQVAVTDIGVTFFSIPGSGQAPTLVRYAAGELDTVLTANESLGDIGRLIRPQVAAATSDEDLLLTTTLASDPGPSRPTVIGILSGNDFRVLDRERTAAPGGEIVDLRAVGMDEQGRALYIARIGESGDNDAPKTLRLNDGFTSIDVATEHAPLPGTDKTLVRFEAQRINRRGDVAFVAELGRIDGLTTIIEEVRVVVRLSDGTYLAPVSSARPGDIGTLSDFEIAGFDDQANLLIIATRDPSQTVLLLAPPFEP
ncbi:MAG TPA: hypothetical protein VIS07_23020 [Candidatus Binatia bacterium]